MASQSLTGLNLCPHDRFFFSDGGLYLSVENTLYCVHKFLFEIHADMFPARDLETSLTKPYVLGDVNKTDFDRLLASLYPRTLWVEEAKTTQEWVSILKLASNWGFKSLRSRAMSKIEQTVDSPIDMVTLGRQYGIPNILLPGYAILCQSTVPLSPEEGIRLGMEDVLNIYRIRHELGSGIAPISLEIALAKVKEAGLGAERPRQEFDSERASTWTDVESVATSQISTEKELDTLTSSVEFPPLEVSSTDRANLVLARAEQRQINVHSSSDTPTSVVLGNRGPIESERDGFQLLDEVIKENYDLISIEIVQWVNTKDIQTLHKIVRLMLEKAIKAGYRYHPCVCLCRAMMKYTQMLHQVARLIVEKAIEAPSQFHACAQLCGNMMSSNDNKTTKDAKVFLEYLGEICKENLEAHITRVRRQRLIGFINELGIWWMPDTIDKWFTALLDVNDEEKVTTLSMLMPRVGRWSSDREYERDLRYCFERWLQRVTNAAQEASKPRVRTLLDMKKLRERNWIAESTEDCSLQ